MSILSDECLYQEKGFVDVDQSDNPFDTKVKSLATGEVKTVDEWFSSVSLEFKDGREK